MILMEITKKYMCEDEQTAENKVEAIKKETEGMVIDYKISNKENKNGIYTILTIKERMATNEEAKDAIGI